jgi:CHASE3 domain sensor protein
MQDFSEKVTQLLRAIENAIDDLTLFVADEEELEEALTKIREMLDDLVE